MSIRETKRLSIRLRVLAECGYRCMECQKKHDRLRVTGCDKRAWKALCPECCGRLGYYVKQALSQERAKQLTLADMMKNG